MTPELVGLFERLQLPHAIMGGIAVMAHGLPRPTFDVDFVIAVPLGVAGQLEQALAKRKKRTSLVVAALPDELPVIDIHSL